MRPAPARSGRPAGSRRPLRRPGSRSRLRPGKVRLRRTRRFFRRPTVRVVSALIGVFVIWVAFSAGQATFQNNGQGAAANLAEWARNHYLGPVVTFGEWLSYNPPKVGGKPSMSLAVPKGEQVSPAAATKAKDKRKEFVPDIPATLTSLAGKPITGEGQWRVVEKVNGEPAILTTFLRDATYTSYVNGIASIDQRLVRFYLRPGYEDPGYGNWKAPSTFRRAAGPACSPRSTAGSRSPTRGAASTSTASTTTRSSTAPRRSSTTRTARSRSASGAATSR